MYDSNPTYGMFLMMAIQFRPRRRQLSLIATLGVLSALASCETQSGAALQVSFAPGSIDHLEFFFANGNATSTNELRAIPQLAPANKPLVLLRDYAANDSVTISASDSSFVYFVPSSATPKGNKVIVVGYLKGEPVSFDRETIVVADSRVNEYALALASPADNQGLADFGREKYQCIAVKTDRSVDAVTRTDDIDCDGIKTSDDTSPMNMTCDIDVLDRKASDVESCDGRDTGGDCIRFDDRVDKFCAQTDIDGDYCRLGSSFACDDSSPSAARESECDGVAPESAEPANAGAAICVDPSQCTRPVAPGFDLTELPATIVCEVQFKPGDTKSCTKITLPAALTGQPCQDADYIAGIATTMKFQTNADANSCTYIGEVLTHDANQTSALVWVTLAVANKPGVRRINIVQLKYKEVPVCTLAPPCSVIPTGAFPTLRNTCD